MVPDIRPATAADAARVTEIARAAKAHWGYPEAWLYAWRDALTITPEYIEANSVFVAEGAGAELRATGDGTPVATEPGSAGIEPAAGTQRSVLGMCALEDDDDHWQLAHLWVDPGVLGLGIGRALVEHVLVVAGSRRPGSVVRVESDPHAAGFYRRLGFRETGVVPAPMEGDPGRVLPLLELDTTIAP
jgi:ribosomal protein S18 acetylase RimI-like enzyme